jgi:hypothetical protein
LVGALPSGIAATAVAPSKASDFVARFATLEPLPEQDPGVPETMAAQSAGELPQVHAKAEPLGVSADVPSPQTPRRRRSRFRQTKENGAGLRR